MLPYARRSFMGYRLLQEYFCFPQKFFFLDLTGLDRICEAGFGGQAEILLMISPFRARRAAADAGTRRHAKTFRLSCAPIVNLFHADRRADLLDHTRYEYQVVPDVTPPKRHGSFRDRRGGERQSAVRRGGAVRAVLFVPARREPLQDAGILARLAASVGLRRRRRHGCIPLAGRSLVTARAAEPDALTVRTVCTNRDLPARLPFGNERRFRTGRRAPVKRIVALIKPTDALRPPAGQGLACGG